MVRPMDKKLEQVKRQLAAIDAWRKERNADIVKMRKAGKTLQDIGDTTGLTRERVRQLLAKAKGAA